MPEPPQGLRARPGDAHATMTVMLQLAPHHIPWTQRRFEMVSRLDCGLARLLATIPVTVLELSKVIRPPLARVTARRAS